jgi:zinc protease
MQRIKQTFLGMSLGILLLAPVCLSAQKINLPPAKRTQEPNGIRMVTVEYPRVPSITLIAVFPGGKSVESVAGVSEMTATLMKRGTATRNATQLSEEIDFLGGSLEVGVGLDNLQVSLNVLSKDFDAGLDLFADVIRNAQLPETELTRERQLAISGLKAIGEEPRAIATVTVPQTLYPNHPYGTTQTLTSLEKMTRAEVQKYYQENVTPSRMILVVVGSFKTADLQAKLRAKFGDWQGEKSAGTALPKAEAKEGALVLVDKPDATQTQVRLLRKGLPKNHPDHYAAEVANTILGGGFTSRLTDEIRVNRSLTYGIGSSFQENLLGGAFSISTFTKVETTKDILQAIREVLKKTVEQGFSAEELRKVKGYLSGFSAIRAQTPQALAAQFAQIESSGLPKDYLSTYIQKIQAVTLNDVNRIAKTYFKPEGMTFVLVAPAEKVKGQIKGFGTFEIKTVESLVK